MKKILTVILLLCCTLPAVAKKRQNEEIITPLTQLEKRQFQTRNYEVQDSIIAMKAILNVLQDEGFVVYNVNSLLGYIYGAKDFDTSDPNISISKEFGVTKSRLNYNGVKVATLEVSINVTQYAQNARIRVNFRRKLLNEYGNAQMIDDINDAQYYDDFYSKVDSAIALQKQINSKIQNKPAKNVISKPKPAMKEEKVDEVPDSKELEQVPEENSGSEGVSNDDQSTMVIPQPEESETRDVKIEDLTKEEDILKPEKTINETPVVIQKESNSDQEINVKASKQEEKELKEQLKYAKKEAIQQKKAEKQAQKESIKAQKIQQVEEKRAQKEAAKAQKIEEKQTQKETKINQKIQQAEEKRAQKEAAKAQKIEEKQTRKETKKAQKIQRAEEKRAQKEDKKAQKNSEKEAKRKAKEFKE